MLATVEAGDMKEMLLLSPDSSLGLAPQAVEGLRIVGGSMDLLS